MKYRRGLAKVAVVIAVTAAAIALLAHGFILTLLRPERLARGITDGAWPIPGINDGMRGRLEIGRVEWGPTIIADMLIGRPHTARATTIRVVDPNGKVVTEAPELTTRIPVWPAIWAQDLFFWDSHIPRLTARVEAIPGVQPGETEIGLFAAFKDNGPSSDDDDPPGSVIDVRNLSVDELDLAIVNDNWDVHIPKMKMRGNLNDRGLSPKRHGLLFDVEVPEPVSGILGMLNERFELQDIQIEQLRTKPERPQDFHSRLHGRIAGAETRVRAVLGGFFTDDATVDLSMDLQNAAEVLNKIVAPIFAGEPVGKVSITGLLADALIDAKLDGARLATPNLFIEGPIGAHVRVQGDVVTVVDARVRILGAQAKVTGTFNLESKSYKARIELDGSDLSAIDRKLAGTLHGTLDIEAREITLVKGTADLTYRPRATTGLPRAIKLRGPFTARLPHGLDLHGVALSAAGSSATVTGTVNFETGEVSGRAQLRAEHPGGLLSVLREGRGLQADLALHGTFYAPQATGKIALRSLTLGPVSIEEMRGAASFDTDTLRIDPIEAKSEGGTIEGTLEVGPIGENATIALLAEAKDLQVAEITGTPHSSGLAHGSVEITGSVDHPNGRFTLSAPDARLFGLEAGISGVVELAGNRVLIRRAEARQVKGGTLSVRGSIDLDSGVLDLTTDAKRIALGRTTPVLTNGSLDGRLKLNGSTDAPLLNGKVRVHRLEFLGIVLGSGFIEVQAGGDATRLTGRFLGGKLRADGYLTLGQRPAFSAQIELDNADLTNSLPAMKRYGVVEAPATGRMRMAWNLERGLHFVDATITRLRVSIQERVGSGERVDIRNRGSMHVTYQNGRATIESSELVSAAGSFDVAGWIGAEQSDLVLRGRLRLEVLRVFLRRWVETIQGEARADIRITGPVRDPQLTGSLDLFGAFLLPREVDKALYLPQGSLQISPETLAVQNLLVQMGDATVVANGRVDHTNFKPNAIDIELEGDLPAEILLVVMPRHIASAGGTLGVAIRVTGTADNPKIRGELKPSALELVPRTMRRTIEISSGNVSFDESGVRLRKLRGRIEDGEVSLEGKVDLASWRPTDVRVRIRGVNIPHRVPDQYDAEVSVDLSLTGTMEGLRLAGQVDLVEARYTQNFDVTELILKPKVVEEDEPLWQGVPLLSDMELALHVSSTGSSMVKNNIAEIALATSLDVSGTPVDPRLEGEIRAEEGEFHIPLMRGNYTVDSGSIIFDRDDPIMEGRVNLTGETIVEDITGAEHPIRLTLKGTLETVTAGFSSDSGLEAGQILTLLWAGRTTEQLRAELRGGDEASGSPAPRGSAVDEPLKEFSGDLFSVLVDPLTKALRLDTGRLKVGSTSAELELCKRLFGRRVESCFEYEEFGTGRRTQTRGSLRLDNHFSFGADYERFYYGDEVFQEDPQQARFQLRSSWRLR